MRKWIDSAQPLNETVVVDKLHVREIETPKGTWVWQYGYVGTKGELRWPLGHYKTAKGAVTAAQRVMMNPNGNHQYTSQFFKDPVIVDRLPLVQGNPFYEGPIV